MQAMRAVLVACSIEKVDAMYKQGQRTTKEDTAETRGRDMVGSTNSIPGGERDHSMSSVSWGDWMFWGSRYVMVGV